MNTPQTPTPAAPAPEAGPSLAAVAHAVGFGDGTRPARPAPAPDIRTHTFGGVKLTEPRWPAPDDSTEAGE